MLSTKKESKGSTLLFDIKFKQLLNKTFKISSNRLKNKKVLNSIFLRNAAGTNQALKNHQSPLLKFQSTVYLTRQVTDFQVPKIYNNEIYDL